MHLSAQAPEGKPQRACTPESHAAIKASEALFQTLTTDAGFQPDGAGGQLELGTCRNCGSTLARKCSEAQMTIQVLGIPDPGKCARKGCTDNAEARSIWCHEHQGSGPAVSCDNLPAMCTVPNCSQPCWPSFDGVCFDHGMFPERAQ